MRVAHVEEIRENLLSHFFSPAQDPASLIGRFCAIQIDPVSIVAPNHMLVVAARSTYSEMPNLADLYAKGEITEVYAKERCLILRKEAPLFWPLVRARREKHRLFLAMHKSEIKRLLQMASDRDGIGATELETKRISSGDGWGPRRLGTRLLNLLWQTGKLTVKSRNGARVRYALASSDMWRQSGGDAVTSDMIRLARWQRYLDGVAITDNRDRFLGFEQCKSAERQSLLYDLVESGGGVRITGFRPDMFIVASSQMLENDTKRPSVLPCFISPLDNFIWHRELVRDLWGLDYRWEIYTPAAKRKFGAYAMPLVTQEGIHGPVDFYLDRKSSVLCGGLSRCPLRNASREIKSAAEEAALKLAHTVGAARVRFL
jgi:uncharacterized protein